MSSATKDYRNEVVVLGDTRDLYHHGCDAVLAQIIGGLTDVGLAPASVVNGMDWNADPDACLRSGLLIINGEGALHHNRPIITKVLEIAEKRKDAKLPTALINTSWFANDHSLTKRLTVFDLIAVRDIKSQAHMREVGLNTLLVHDLAIREALSHKIDCLDSIKSEIVVGDSTEQKNTRVLRILAKKQGFRYLPVLRPPLDERPGKKPIKIRRKFHQSKLMGPLAKFLVSPRYHAHLVGIPDLGRYCQALANSSGIITGRFHMLCFAIGLRIPFVAIASNTPKIESLIEAAGLNMGKRMTTPDRLIDLEGVPPWTAEEIESLEKFLQVAESSFDELFAKLHSLFPEANKDTSRIENQKNNQPLVSA